MLGVAGAPPREQAEDSQAETARSSDRATDPASQIHGQTARIWSHRKQSSQPERQADSHLRQAPPPQQPQPLRHISPPGGPSTTPAQAREPVGPAARGDDPTAARNGGASPFGLASKARSACPPRRGATRLEKEAGALGLCARLQRSGSRTGGDGTQGHECIGGAPGRPPWTPRYERQSARQVPSAGARGKPVDQIGVPT
jgi:hypothetical protein